VRTSRFSYACGACSRCCRDKRIRVNPYEVARLARSQGISTSRFLSDYTDGVELQRRDDGTCVFLGEAGCTVHPDRPLVCRLYPLGRHVDPAGRETFSHVAPHPETAGRYSEEGTVQDWLDSQGAGPFLEATDAYLTVFYRLFAAMAAREGGGGVTGWPEDAGNRPTAWMDIDSAIGPPRNGESIEGRMAAHIRWLGEREV
jgi:Fe-S-cluster containining protein